MPLEQYGALGDGRSVALIGLDGSIDWWCVPHMDSPPLFDKLLAPQTGGFFSITPSEPFVAERRYLPGSNILETIFITRQGRARLTESLNSGPAGRLPWAELGRRIEGIEGKVNFEIAIDFGTQADTVSPYVAPNDNACVFHAGRILGMFLHDHHVHIERKDDMGVRAVLSLAAGQRSVVAIIAGRDEPLVAPPLALIDERIDGSHREWCQWSKGLVYDGPHQTQVLRNALALKLLLSSLSGSIMAAATSSLPERIGGSKNYDYRFAWIRDAGYTIEAFLGIGAQPEAKAAFTWLLRRLDEYGPRVFYTLDGAIGDCVRPVDLPGYKNSPPVVGNDARDQLQHGVFGDIFETARCFIDSGNILDSPSAMLLSGLADQCADCWRQQDAGIWELPEKQHYTMSKISCWQALSRAIELADGGHLPTTCRERWDRERQRIQAWIEGHCWSEERQAYLFYPDSDRLDASLTLAVRFGYPSKKRLRSTLEAIDHDLGAGAFHYRYTDAQEEEGCFLACTFWLIEAWAILDNQDRAEAAYADALEGLSHGVGIYSEMIDPQTGHYLGNLPQGLTHLAALKAAMAIGGCHPER
ncbi:MULTISPECIES: glycoside hydrolase family 15 protein [Pseudomonas]|uniref:Glycosyl hydrolase n=3 Tax=Pseudomonas putida group TaxID=136845 RepID=V9UWZ0_9PSED|nr:MULTISPECIES: glycoside hydrolase family 15 protein [Pseudomonas]AFO46189.1 glycoside hydrolase 15-related protein [Pseudomonas putida DOT-T1E]AHC82346.1 glycosyl hydrolase [Pseudomonas monteilii SB3078]AHC87724.1 glycosyl hydrolase [Pseudomonas monteilii SB3101]MDD2008036.1 glycoside hydrolase family 15 protein [Pseudomonas putida]MDS9590909.1 glycoside hydrolase family 15 protein [Pseudomonas sp. HTZ1]